MIIDETIGFVERNKDKPFYVNVWLNDTHGTLDPDEKQLEPYRSFFPRDVPEKYTGALAVYYSAATNADYHIGRLVDRLDALGLDDNTVVIFSADNGPEDIVINDSCHSGVGSPGPFRGRKRSLYEGGVRTPFIVRWPNGHVPKGKVNSNTILSAVDLLPTFCRLAGVQLDTCVKTDGENMVDVLAGSTRNRTSPLMWEWRFGIAGHPINKSPMMAIRDGEWKLLANLDRNRVELYNIPEDPMEVNNRASQEPKIAAILADRLTSWHHELPEGPCDPKAGSNEYPWPGTF